MNERSGYSGAVRKAVVADWQRCLPQFGPYGPRGLGRRVGCLLQGVELDRGSSSDGYRPILFCCALTVDLVAVDLSLSNTSLPDAGGYPWVTIREHPTGHASVAMKLVERSPIPAAGPVKLSLFVNASRLTASTSYLYAADVIYRKVCLACAWCEQPELVARLLEEGAGVLKRWQTKQDIIERLGGVQGWQDDVWACAQDKDGVVRTVLANVSKLGLTSLPIADLIVDADVIESALK